MPQANGNTSGSNLPATAEPSSMNRAYKQKKSHDQLMQMFGEWDKALDQKWSSWRDEAKEAYDVTAGRQWDKEAEEQAEIARLTTIAVNKVDSTVSAICGSEMTNRQEVKYYPREMSTQGPDGQRQDAVVNEILTAAAEWIRDECDAADEESEAFRDCIICGCGVTETRMDYENDPEGVALIMRIDPLEIVPGIDAAAVRPNAVDASYIRRKRKFTKDEAKRRFGVEGKDGYETSGQRQPHSNYPGSAYNHSSSDLPNDDEVEIKEYQWFDLEKVYKVMNPRSGRIEEVPEDVYNRLLERIPELEQMSYSTQIRTYWRAFVCGSEMLECTALPDGEFTYKFITGKLDRNKGVWYGVVRAMIEPQKLLNKQISQIQRIIDNNAKGGLLAEVDAFEDPDQAKLDYAASDTIVWLKSGSLGAHPRVMPKPVGNYPAGIDKLLMIANEAVPGVSGVNQEMLGIVDREQAGVVDVQRKEAAYGVLKAFFNSLRRYRKLHGRHLLKLIQKYMTDGRLVRIIGRNGNVQYLPLIRDPDVARYDVIVDEAPTGPTQKEKVFQFLAMFGGPLLAKLNLPPQIMLKFLEFSPLPTALVAEIMQMVSQMPPQPNPEEEKAKGEAAKAQADMQKAQMDAQMQQMQMQMDAQSNAMKMQMEMQKLQSANQKLAIENEWVKLEMQKTQMQQQSDAQEAAIRMRETQMREMNDTRKIDADIEKMRLDTEIKREELEIKRAEVGMKQQELSVKKEELGFKRDEMATNASLKEKEINTRAAVDSEKIAQGDRQGFVKADIEGRKIDSKERTDNAKIESSERTAKNDDREARWEKVSKSLSDMTEAMKRPRKIVRDKNGRATGLE